MDVVIVTPEKGKAKEIGQRLLALADYPRQVQWVTWPQAGFQIPLELFARFDADGEDSEQPQAAQESTPRRRRGRPRKEETDSTDNTSPEEE